MKWLSLVLLSVSSLFLLADGPQTGNLQGTVYDSNRAPLPGANVQLEGSKGTKSTVTNQDGVYRFPSLEPGAYTLTFSLTGFQTTKGNAIVSVGLTSTVNAALGVELTDTIQVTADTPMVDRSNVSVGGNVKTEVTEKLAVGRSYQSVLQLLPGVTGGGNPNVNGGLDGENLYLVDGVDTTDATTGTFGANLNFNAIQEIAVVTGGVGAEFGRAAGGVFNIVTKSGGNTFEGGLQWTITNQDWNSDSKHVTTNYVDHHINPYNVSLGGPILKDRLFFFVTREDGTLSSSRAGLVGPEGSYSRDFEATYDLYKVTWMPNQNHSIQATHAEDPAVVPVAYHGNTRSWDIDTVNLQGQGGDFNSLKWSWVVNPEWVVDTQIAQQESEITVTPWQQHALSGDAESPSGNHSTYLDQASGYRYNGVLYDGFVRRPRDQASVNVTWFTTFNHEIKFGLDYQKTESQNYFQLYGGELYQGRGFNASAPGGFDTPLNVRRYVNPDQLTSENTNTALYISDRFTIGSFFLSAGLRIEQQKGKNDVGESVIDATNLAPRISGSYDLSGDNTYLITFGVNRYYSPVISGLIDDFNRGVGAGAIYDLYNWNPETGHYDTFVRRVDLSGNNATINKVDPYYEDEFTVGFDWQFSKLWAFKSKVLQSKVNNIFDNITDYDVQAGEEVAEFQTVDDAERKYFGVQLSVERRLDNNWQFASNYTWSKAEGNFFDESDDDFGTYRSVSDLALRNRYGKAPHDRTHMLKTYGNYVLNLGSRNSLNFGLRFQYQSGTPWAMTQTSEVAFPDGGSSTVTEYLEERGSNRLGSTHWFDVNVAYDVTIWRSVKFHLGIDAFNVTDQQKAVAINTTTGQTSASLSSYQTPRNYRVIAGFKF